MVGIPGFGGSDKTLMDYIEERAKEQIEHTLSENAILPKKMDLQFFAKKSDIK